jgi:pterin-4a-carbinolamine dehydratase
VAIACEPNPVLFSALRHWRREGDTLVRELSFRDFDEALRFVERVAVAAEVNATMEG